MEYYTGIGSRNTPDRVLEHMEKIAQYLAKRRYTLRSGGAEGADKAFERGCDAGEGTKEVYLPWRHFNGSKSGLCHVSREAEEFAKKYHPAWGSLSSAGQLLIARDGYQVMGRDLKTPSKFVICWTIGAKVTGGTGQAIRIALAHSIPVINLADSGDILSVNQWMTLNLDFLEETMYNLFQ